MESGKIIVVANQKGGVAKTSTVRNLSYALAEMGKKVLVVDFDPQYNLTTSFGVLPTQAPYNTGTLITNLLLDESLPDTNEFIQKIDSVDLIPSSRYLTVAEAKELWIARTRAFGNISHGGQSSSAPFAYPTQRSRLWREPM